MAMLTLFRSVAERNFEMQSGCIIKIKHGLLPKQLFICL